MTTTQPTERLQSLTTQLAGVEREMKRKGNRPGRKVELGFMRITLRRLIAEEQS